MTSVVLSEPEFERVGEALAVAEAVVDSGVAALAAAGGPDVAEVLAYDVAHAAAGLRTARAALAYGALGEVEARIACAFAADAIADLVARTAGRETTWGVRREWVDRVDRTDAGTDPVPFDGSTYTDPVSQLSGSTTGIHEY